MSDKKLLAENTVRRFMKLANVDTLTDNFVAEAYDKDNEKMEEEVETTDDVVEEELDLYEQEEDEEEPMEMDVEMGDDDAVADAPEMDDEPMMGEADISLTEEEAQLLIDLGERLKEAMGADEDMGDMAMAADEEPEPAEEPDVDLEGEEGEDEDDEDEMMQEEIVNEVLKRVTQRIIREKMARK